jgi:hypothetical protein
MDFINYVSKPVPHSQMMYLYNISNITHPKCELYSDFIVSLVELAYMTYLGDDVMGDIARKEHFHWCWDTTVKTFALEGYDFHLCEELYDYIYTFINDTFYTQTDKGFDVDELTYYWKHVFDFSKGDKTRSDLDVLIEIYNLFSPTE